MYSGNAEGCDYAGGLDAINLGLYNGTKRAEHDYQDMEYVLLLSRADGLLTKDNDCLCLAKAAFPDKDVFSSLDEVPEDYICHWT